ncbi:glycerol-3-phosphate responsive antiterminator [Jeotgalicoccus meleagridis]|uniref:Glycerol uptake operon antiterminator regulatory protein n=1 Tax=Jeotgalicoccus meleagridis TaxID=2759181 RepID=A0A6V7RAX9_9STAP|nr:glycerol-3-phosphate responsive antiterminator [Jeotgalicoccus meleagridis]CAD2074025.1 Glycerol uptake operon antiterminator regulatory protein [Jeotgalicoccus meleagridis]HIS18303.1 glycerol-3-phosphate responsive antiterminator [Candidatus Coprovivens excrementavium]
MIKDKNLIASVLNFKQLEQAIEFKENLKCVFILFGNISNLKDIVQLLNDANIPSYVHIEYISGLKVDDYAFKFLKNNIKVKGIITTKSGHIKRAHKENLEVVQRSFIVDTRMLKLTLRGLDSNKPDYLEIMPALVSNLIPEMKKHTGIPIITGGLVNDEYVYEKAIENGADAVSTSNIKMWKYISNNY